MKKLKSKKHRQFELVYVQGVEGNSIYLNDTRIAGPKPWGGGTVLKRWKVEEDQILEAMIFEP